MGVEGVLGRAWRRGGVPERGGVHPGVHLDACCVRLPDDLGQRVVRGRGYAGIRAWVERVVAEAVEAPSGLDHQRVGPEVDRVGDQGGDLVGGVAAGVEGVDPVAAELLGLLDWAGGVGGLIRTGWTAQRQRRQHRQADHSGKSLSHLCPSPH